MPPQALAPAVPVTAGAPLADLVKRRDQLAARLRATLPPDVADDRRRLVEDRAWYEQRSAGATEADRHDLAVRAEVVQRGQAALDTWIGAHRAELVEWRRLGRVADRRADLVALAAALDPASPARRLVGPEPPLGAARLLWRQAIREVAVHADRWPDQPGGLGPPDPRSPDQDRPVAASVSQRRRDRALQDLERALDRTAGRQLDRDTGLGL
jgi:hypothetical protein